MNIIISIDNHINSKIKHFEEIVKYYKSILDDDKIKQIVDNVLSFDNPIFYAHESFCCENNLLFSFNKKESVYFEFNFKKSSENKEIFCEMSSDGYGEIICKLYFIIDDHKYYSFNYEIFNKAQYFKYNSEFNEDINNILPESCKDINQKIAYAFEMFLNNSNNVKDFKYTKFNKKDILEKMLKEKLDERLSKEIFK